MKPKKTEDETMPDEMLVETVEDAAGTDAGAAGDAADAVADAPQAADREAQAGADARRHRREVSRAIRELTDEDNETRVDVSWRTIIGGDILLGGWFRRQFWMIILVTFFTIIYVSNRYSCQQEMIERNRLTDTLLDRKYRALTRSSELLEMTLRSRVEEELRDSTIQTSTTPLYAIKTDE